MLLFGAFTHYIFAALETGVVQRGGHLAVYHAGIFPVRRRAIRRLMGSTTPRRDAALRDDPVLRKMIAVLTPTQAVIGIAGNFSGGTSASKTFFGVGLVGADQEQMRQWDDYGAGRPYVPDDRLSDPDRDARRDRPRRRAHARVVRTVACAELSGAGTDAGGTRGDAPPLDPALADLAQGRAVRSAAAGGAPQIQLLSATAAGGAEYRQPGRRRRRYADR